MYVCTSVMPSNTSELKNLEVMIPSKAVDDCFEFLDSYTSAYYINFKAVDVERTSTAFINSFGQSCRLTSTTLLLAFSSFNFRDCLPSVLVFTKTPRLIHERLVK